MRSDDRESTNDEDYRLKGEKKEEEREDALKARKVFIHSMGKLSTNRTWGDFIHAQSRCDDIPKRCFIGLNIGFVEVN